MWKKSQRGRSSGGSFGGGRSSASNTFFKCRKPGHWAKNCTERQGFKNLGCFVGKEKVKFAEIMELARRGSCDTEGEGGSCDTEGSFQHLPQYMVQFPSPPPPMEPPFTQEQSGQTTSFLLFM